MVWRARIGCFTCSRSYKSKNDGNNYRARKCFGMHNSYLSVIVLIYMLLIGGIESNPGPTLEELIERSEERLTVLINSSLKQSNETLQAVNSLKGKVNDISTQLSGMQDNLSDAQSRILKLEKENEELHTMLDKLDNNSRKNNIIVFGLPEVDGNDNPAADFASFAINKLEIDISPNVLSNAYRIGKNHGHRPLFVQFSQYKFKNQVMQNVSKLKGTKISISDDLTPSARAHKKIILKCSNEAKSAGHEVKIKNNYLLVDNIKVNYDSLKKPNWLHTFSNKEGIESSNERKRTRTSSPSQHGVPNKELRHSDGNSTPHISRKQGNGMPPPQQTEGGAARPRSTSRGKKGK